MLYLCQILGSPVFLPDGRRAGQTSDLLIPAGALYPVVESLVVGSSSGAHCVPWDLVRSVDERGFVVEAEGLQRPARGEQDPSIALREDLLDKQIVDTDGRRVVRVNDFQLLRNDHQLLVLGVDVSTRGLLRRLGMEGFVERVVERLGYSLPRSIIPWDVVDQLDGRDLAQLRLTVSHRKLVSWHPADLAEILTDLHGRERNTLFQSLNAETAAGALQELEEDVQVSILNALSDEQAASVLEEMDPDDAADLIEELSPERIVSLLSRMEAEEAADVQELLSYPPDSAGRIMTTEFFALSSTLTAQQTIDFLRERKPDAESVYYLYILDPHEHLLGVLTLRDLIVSSPETPVTEFMLPKVHKVLVTDTLDEVRETMNKYDLLAIPVVDDNGCMHGIVTVDDVMDRMMPSTWKRRFPRIF